MHYFINVGPVQLRCHLFTRCSSLRHDAHFYCGTHFFSPGITLPLSVADAEHD
jgi:hypothetical protein